MTAIWSCSHLRIKSTNPSHHYAGCGVGDALARNAWMARMVQSGLAEVLRLGGNWPELVVRPGDR